MALVLSAERNPNDVLCGRGMGVYEYSGCVRFRELIHARLEEYHSVKGIEAKTRIALEVLDCIRSRSDPPGRFLCLAAPGVWRLADERAVMEKVKQAFRSQKKAVLLKGGEHTERTEGSASAGDREEAEAGPPEPSAMFLPLDAVAPPSSASDGNTSAEEMGPFAGLQGLRNDAHPTMQHRSDDGSDGNEGDGDANDAAQADIVPASASDLPIFTHEDERVELATLTIKEMVSAQKDLHGTIAGMGNLRVSGGTEDRDDDEYQRASAEDIVRLEAELENLPATEKASYLRARQECPHLLTQDHKAPFLEREALDARLAAQRMALYWDIRYQTFGPELCYLPMTLAGAMKDEVEGMMKHCALGILPVTDAKGRAILFSNPERRNYERFSPEREARVIFYLFHTLAANAVSRRAGVVVLIDARRVARQNMPLKNARYLVNTMVNAQPIKMRSVHVCNPSAFVYYVAFPIMKAIRGREFRLRFRMHYGDEDKVLADLEGYGLPRDRLPMEIAGELVVNFEQLVAGQCVKEVVAVEKNEVKDWVEKEEEMPKKRRKAAVY